MTFNIRKHKLQAKSIKRELRTCDPRSREKLRAKLKAREMAVLIATQNLKDSVQSRAARAHSGVRSTGSRGVA